MINGLPVVTPPTEIDITTTDHLHAVLLHAAARGHTTIVVDMTRTRFCGSAGLTVLVRAHKRGLAEGGELRLIITAGGPVARILAITRLDQVIPLFDSLEEALAPRPAAVIRPLRARPSPGLRRERQPGLPGGGANTHNLGHVAGIGHGRAIPPAESPAFRRPGLVS